MSVLNSHVEARFIKGDLNVPTLPMQRSLQALSGILKEFVPTRSPATLAIVAKVKFWLVEPVQL